MPVLATKDLTYYYFSDRNIFENLNLKFERGKVYVILGASGSGKTTLLSLLGGLDTPKGGEILFEGKNIAEMGLEQYRHNCVSFVFQSYNLIEYMTPKENVQLVERARSLDKCVIIVSHSSEVAAAGDVILRFSHGKIDVS